MSLTKISRASGFTLIEILVVILIISIVSAVALVTISPNSEKDIEQFAKKLDYLLKLASDEALLDSRTLGLGFTPDQLQFFAYQENDSDENPWRLMKQHNVNAQAIPSSVHLTLTMNKASIPLDGEPHIVISEDGSVTPFALIATKNHGTERYQITCDANGNTSMERIHDEE